MGPRNKCGDDNTGCMCFVKLAPMGFIPATHRSTNELRVDILPVRVIPLN